MHIVKSFKDFLLFHNPGDVIINFKLWFGMKLKIRD
jgi:hypothetical protein